MIDRHRGHFLRSFLYTPTLAVALTGFLTVTLLGVRPAAAQTFNVIYNFTLGNDGGGPLTGVTMDRNGNLYGTTGFGGTTGNGTVFKLSNTNSSWVLTPLYEFQGGSDGATSNSPISIARDGQLYGATLYGGGTANCGILFKLQPPATAVPNAAGMWKETILHSFVGGVNDGCNPGSGFTWDQAGNFYGTTQDGGANGEQPPFTGFGIVYEMSPSASGWTENILFNFLGSTNGQFPLYAGVVFDNAGAMYGTVNGGGFFGGACEGIGCGLVYKLVSSGGSWSETVLYSFRDGDDGEFPNTGVFFDSSGNVYGAAGTGGSGQGGTVFELTPSGGGWNFNILASLQESPGGAQGVETPLVMDAQGNLYGTTNDEGPYNAGTVFKLTRTSNGWTYTDLHDFTDGTDGAYPVGPIVFDAAGNLYGAAILGGTDGAGTVWKITP